jgi:hypothetical protein
MKPQDDLRAHGRNFASDSHRSDAPFLRNSMSFTAPGPLGPLGGFQFQAHYGRTFKAEFPF